MPRERILDDIRESLSQELARHYLIPRRDIANIKQACGLEDVQGHQNDQHSVLAWIEEFGQGIPAGWCLSSHEDFNTMTILFKKIKKKCGLLKSRFFMSDMVPQFFNTWIAVMGNARPAKNQCTWHVEQAWREEL